MSHSGSPPNGCMPAGVGIGLAHALHTHTSPSHISTTAPQQQQQQQQQQQDQQSSGLQQTPHLPVKALGLLQQFLGLHHQRAHHYARLHLGFRYLSAAVRTSTLQESEFNEAHVLLAPRKHMHTCAETGGGGAVLLARSL